MNESDRKFREFILERFLKGVGSGKTHKALCKEFNTVTYSRSRVQYWFNKFRSGDLSVENKEKPGRPFTVDVEELTKDVESDPSQSTISLARKYQCSKSVIIRALKQNNFVRIENVWMKGFTEEEKTPEKVLVKKEIVEKELNLEQKIYIVSRYYESGRIYERILEEFDEKFDVKTTDNFVESAVSVITMFETTGSVKENELFYETTQEVKIKDEPQESEEETDFYPQTFVQTITQEPPRPAKVKPKPKTPARVKELKSIYPRECPTCLKMVSPSAFSNHLKLHSDSRDYVCEVCNKAFKTRRYLVSHLEVHTPISERKVYICQICGVKSTRKPNHNKHMKTIHPGHYKLDSV